MSAFRPDLLEGRRALITGGGTGLGFAIAAAYARHGASVVLMGRREDCLQEAATRIHAAGGIAHPAPGDVRSPDECAAAIGVATKALGGLDTLVNAAAGNFVCAPEELSPNGFRAVVDIDLIGTFNMSRAAFAALRHHAPSVILNISATLQYQGNRGQAHAMAAKAGIDGLARGLACEWGEHGIRVCGIAPGYIGSTEGLRRLVPEARRAELAGEVPLGRLGEPEDIADAALFLVSSAAAWITGETLVVDGGHWLYKPALSGSAARDDGARSTKGNHAS